jgi:hypothetical protein
MSANVREMFDALGAVVSTQLAMPARIALACRPEAAALGAFFTNDRNSMAQIGQETSEQSLGD